MPESSRSPASLPIVSAASAAAAASASASAEPVDATRQSFFDAVGGEPTFRALVARFYEGVATDPVLRPMYPEEDLGPAEERLRMFLIQYWGGPRTYSERRGHPRLRMRHVRFSIGTREREAWLAHMRAALDSLELAEPYERLLWNYLETAALSLQNRPD